MSRIFPASVILNIALAFTIAVLAWRNFGPASTRSELSPEATTNPASPVKRVTASAPRVVEPPKFPLYSDFRAASARRKWLVDQLRALGVPNDLLALVAQADFETQWDSHFTACRGDMKKLAVVQLDMDKSKDAEMLAALGAAGFKEWGRQTMLWEALSTKVDVTPAEADAIYDLKKKLQQRNLELEQARVDGTMDDAAINDAQDQAAHEYTQQLKSLLGDDRFAKSQQLDAAFAAGNLRNTLASVNPNDAQFQQLFTAQQQWQQANMALDPAAPDYSAQFKALNDARDQAYQQVLGTDAYNTLQKAQDPGYSQMKKYETYWGLDDSKIDYVYATMKQYEQSMQNDQAQLRALQAQGPGTDVSALNQNLQQLTDQTGQALQKYLGADSFNKLQRNHLFLFTQNQAPQ